MITPLVLCFCLLMRYARNQLNEFGTTMSNQTERETVGEFLTMSELFNWHFFVSPFIFSCRSLNFFYFFQRKQTSLCLKCRFYTNSSRLIFIFLFSLALLFPAFCPAVSTTTSHGDRVNGAALYTSTLHIYLYIFLNRRR